ncbi:MAG: peptidase domain-containing ABC transporter [Acidobacteria bacterium]|nr:peptidase domain-containing ABC transporter [Acidobacteriota bacterium]
MAKRVPFLGQMTPSDCGPTCLAMLARAHGVYLEVEKVRETLGHSPYGVSLAQLAQFAQSEALNPRVFSVSKLEAFDQVALPCLLFWDDKHFVILEKIHKARYSIVDPAKGRSCLSAAEFQAHFSFLAMTLAPTHRVKAPNPLFKLLRHFRRAVRFPRQIAQTLGLSIGLKVLALGVPFLTAFLLDRIVPEGQWRLHQGIGLAFLALILGQLGMNVWRQRVLIDLQFKTDSLMQRELVQHLISLPYSFFQGRPVGDLLVRLQSVKMIRDTFASQLAMTLLDILLVVIFFAAMWFFSPLLACTALGLAVVYGGVSLAFLRPIDEKVKREVLAQSGHQSFAVEALQAIQSVKSGGREQQVVARWWSHLQTELCSSAETMRTTAWLQSIQSALNYLGPALVLWLGTYLVMQGHMRIGQVIAFNFLAGSFLAPISSVIGCLQQMQFIGVHLARLDDIFQREPETYGEHRGALEGEVALEAVSYCYDGQKEPAISVAAMQIPAGSFLGIVGESGSGKSTLAKLVAGLLVPQQGQIVFDEEPMAAWDRLHLRQQMGCVFQESSLLEGTLAENIAFFETDPDLEQVHNAALMACISTLDHPWPNGYQTPVGQNGMALSGGQRQRILLARAFYHQPRIVVLDEATSQLDTLIENRIFQQLQNAKLTRVVITHRVNSLLAADNIWVVDRGHIVEAGPPQTLLEQDSRFRRLLEYPVAAQGV